MKKLLAVMIGCLLPATAQGAFVESFDYSPAVVGTSPVTASGGVGSWGNFTFSGAVSGSGNHEFIATSLSAPAGYGHLPSNGSLRHQTGVFNRASYEGLAVAERIDFDVNGTYYLSYLYRSPLPQNNQIGGRISLYDAGNVRLATVGDAAQDAAASGGDASLTVQGSGSRVYSSLDQFGSNVDTLVVWKIVTSTSGNDLLYASLWDNTETVFAEPTVWDVSTADPITGLAVALRYDSENGFANQLPIFDEIRIGSSFSEVVALVPEPRSLGILSLGILLTLPIGSRFRCKTFKAIS